MANPQISSIGTGKVKSLMPDMCWTPKGKGKELIPYNITANMNLMKSTVTHVQERNKDVVNLYTSVTTVKGDEAGTGGGFVSGVNKGACFPISHSRTVRADKAYVVRHTSIFGMNARPDLTLPNTLGRLTIIKIRGVTLDNDATPEKFDAEYKKLINKHPASTLSDADYDKAAKTLDCDRNMLKAIAREETFGEDGAAGFWHGRAKMLWEPNHFLRNFQRSFTNSPLNDQQRMFLGAFGMNVSRAELTQMYIDQWRAVGPARFIGGGPGGTWQSNLDNFDLASALAPDAAARSASFGLFQLMYQSVDGKGIFNNAAEFVHAMNESELRQLDVFTQYAQKTPGLQQALHDKDFREVARIHNGRDTFNPSRDRVMADGRSQTYADRLKTHKEDLDAEDDLAKETDGVVVPPK